MKTKFSKKQVEILEVIDEIITEMRKCELKYDKEILLKLSLHGETVLDFYYENEFENISEDLFEMISDMTINLDEEFQKFEEKEIFMNDIIYNCLVRYMNDYKLSIIRSFYKENKTGKYANLIINILKEAQFIDKNLNHVYVNHNILEMIMMRGADSFYDQFGVQTEELHNEFILACLEFQNQFKKDYPLMREFNGMNLNYFDKNGIGTRNFIRKIINNITKYLDIEVKRMPIFIDLKQDTRSFKKTIYLRVFVGKRNSGRFVFQHQYDLGKNLKKSEISQIILEVEKIVNHTKPNYDLEDLLDALEEKLGIAA